MTVSDATTPPEPESAPTDPTSAPTTGESPAAPAPFPEYGAYTPPTPHTTEPIASGDPLRGLLAGAGVAVVGAILWAVVVYLTKYEIGLIAVAIGYAVGYVVHRVGGVASRTTAILAAVLAAAGILLGFALVGVAVVARVNSIGPLDAVNAITDDIGWGTVLSGTMDGIAWLFLAIGAFSAWRLVAGQRRPSRRS